MKTGYECFKRYLYVKLMMHQKKSYGINNKKFLKMWNENRRNKDGSKFLTLEKKLSERQMMTLFVAYFLDNNDFYVMDIFEDQFRIYKDFTQKIQNVELFYKKELYNILDLIEKKNLTLKKFMFAEKELPLVLTTGQDSVTIFVLNELFSFLSKVDKKQMDVLSKTKLKGVEKNCTVLRRYFKWKEIEISNFKQLTKEIVMP